MKPERIYLTAKGIIRIFLAYDKTGRSCYGYYLEDETGWTSPFTGMFYDGVEDVTAEILEAACEQLGVEPCDVEEVDEINLPF